MLCGLTTASTDIIFCICCVNWGWDCIDHSGRRLRTTMELMMGRQEQEPQKHTQRHVTANAEWYLSRTANFSYKCVQSSSEIEVDGISSLALLWISCWIICFCGDGEENKSQPSFPPFSVSARRDTMGIHQHLLRTWLQRLHMFRILKFLGL